MDAKTSTTKELKLSAPARQIFSSSQNYVVIEGDKTLTTVDGVTGKQLFSVKLSEKVSIIGWLVIQLVQ